MQKSRKEDIDYVLKFIQFSDGSIQQGISFSGLREDTQCSTGTNEYHELNSQYSGFFREGKPCRSSNTYSEFRLCDPVYHHLTLRRQDCADGNICNGTLPRTTQTQGNNPCEHEQKSGVGIAKCNFSAVQAQLSQTLKLPLKKSNFNETIKPDNSKMENKCEDDNLNFESTLKKWKHLTKRKTANENNQSGDGTSQIQQDTKEKKEEIETKKVGANALVRNKTKDTFNMKLDKSKLESVLKRGLVKTSADTNVSKRGTNAYSIVRNNPSLKDGKAADVCTGCDGDLGNNPLANVQDENCTASENSHSGPAIGVPYDHPWDENFPTPQISLVCGNREIFRSDFQTKPMNRAHIYSITHKNKSPDGNDDLGDDKKGDIRVVNNESSLSDTEIKDSEKDIASKIETTRMGELKTSNCASYDSPWNDEFPDAEVSSANNTALPVSNTGSEYEDVDCSRVAKKSAIEILVEQNVRENNKAKRGSRIERMREQLSETSANVAHQLRKVRKSISYPIDKINSTVSCLGFRRNSDTGASRRNMDIGTRKVDDNPYDTILEIDEVFHSDEKTDTEMGIDVDKKSPKE